MASPLRTLAPLTVAIAVIGARCDAHLEPSGAEDAGPFDAAAPVDAGNLAAVDAGPSDAGAIDARPRCDWGPNPAVPFACDGTEDWCDPAGDTPDAETDLLAMWSRVDADTLVLQFRFAAPPFRNNVEDDLYVEFENAQVADAAGYPRGTVLLCQDTRPPDSAFCLSGNIIVAVSWDRESPIASDRAYPPEQYGTDPAVFAPDRCAARLGRSSPLLELRLPSAQFTDADGVVSYAAMLPADSSGPPWDFSWLPGEPAFVRSRGGRANDDTDLVSFCDLNCPMCCSP